VSCIELLVLRINILASKPTLCSFIFSGGDQNYYFRYSDNYCLNPSKIVDNSVSGAPVFIFTFHFLGDQFSKLMSIPLKNTHIMELKTHDDTCCHCC
jgi:hypothetical protein